MTAGAPATGAPDTGVAKRLAVVRAKIAAAEARAGRPPGSVTLVCVSKVHPAERIVEAYDAGALVFGENYIQELEEKRAALAYRCPAARWHFIGRVQRNKAKLIAAADLVHGAGSAAHLDALARHGPTRALLQVNLDDEDTKGGLTPAALQAPELWKSRAGCTVDGLMIIPAPGTGPQAFAALARLRDELQDRFSLSLPHLSMGMSDDYEEAVAAGATLVRVGTAIFGPRPVADPPEGDPETAKEAR